MSATSAQRGYAFEYANILSAIKILKCKPNTKTDEWLKKKGKPYFQKLTDDNSDKMIKASRTLMKFLSQKDERAAAATCVEKVKEGKKTNDVTDIRLFNENNNDSVRISAKSNHDAARHQRVSPHIDIGKEWLGIESDEKYNLDMKQIFGWLLEFADLNGIDKFSDMNKKEKHESLYRPVCESVAGFLNRAFSHHNNKLLAKNLIAYLAGEKDFYKAQANLQSNSLTIKSFNLRGTLPLGKKLSFPTELIKLNAAESSRGTPNRVIINFNNNWSIDMRIHSASTKIENSLKFDTRLVESPAEKWVINF